MMDKTNELEKAAQANAVAISAIQRDLVALRERVTDGFNNVRCDIRDLKAEIVTKAEFKPYQVILGIMGSVFLGYILKLVAEKLFI